MDKLIYKALQECQSLEVSSRVYVVTGEGYSVENIFSSSYYSVRRFNSGETISYYSNHLSDDDLSFDEMEMFDHLFKAVSRRGLTAMIGDSFASDSWSGGQPHQWEETQYRPTFQVDGVLCVCTGFVDDHYSFLPLPEFIKQLKTQKDAKDEYDRQCYLDRYY